MLAKLIKNPLIVAAFLLGSFFSVQALTPTVAYAGLFDGAKENACSGAQLKDNAQCDANADKKIGGIIKDVINLLSVIIGIIAVIIIIVSGLRYILSGGESQSVSGAKNGIIYAIVGLIFVAFAQLIVKFVLGNVK